MNRARTLIVSLAVGIAGVAGVFALGQTLTLGQQSRGANEQQIAARAAQLDRYEASLRTQLRRKTPPLPPVPAQATAAVAAPAPAPAPTRVVYQRPAPIVVTTHRHGDDEDEHEAELEGGEADD